jgi:phosphatidylinositol alpha-1,6-mannosyltransferase
LPREETVVVAADYPGWREFDLEHDVKVVRLPLTMPQWGLRSVSGFRNYARLFRRLRRIVKNERVGQVHVGRCLPEGWLAWMLKKWIGIPYAVYVHGEEVEHASSSREHSWMVRRVIGGAEYLIANSLNTRRILQTEWRVPEEKIKVLHPGVDTSRFRPAARDPAFRREMGWDDRPVVLTVGRLQQRKGHDVAIRAMETIRRNVPDVLYAICGGGEERERLEGIVREHGLERHVQFLGEIDDKQMIRCYQQCDVFVLANRQVGRDIEGFGMVLLEAQACGKPVIAGDSGGTAETMQIGETGYIVDCTQPEPLAEILSELLRDPVRCEAMGARGREWAVNRFDWEALARQARRLFQGEDGSKECEAACEAASV